MINAIEETRRKTDKQRRKAYQSVQPYDDNILICKSLKR